MKIWIWMNTVLVRVLRKKSKTYGSPLYLTTDIDVSTFSNQFRVRMDFDWRYELHVHP
jgi:hypothetical protein